jgi:hypothetical protein
LLSRRTIPGMTLDLHSMYRITDPEKSQATATLN